MRIPIQVAVILALLAIAISCKENVDVKTPEGAFTVFTKALREKDKNKVYEMSCKEVKSYFDELYKQIDAARQLVMTHYPPHLQKSELPKIGGQYVDGVKDGRGLFVNLSSLKALQTGTAVVIGLSHSGASIKDGVATFRTAAGEIYVFKKENDGVWRADWLVLIKDSVSKSGLMGNFEVVRRTVKNLQSLHNASRDVRRPEGAYNHMRLAFIKRDAGVMYDLCSAKCRQMFAEAYKYLLMTKNKLQGLKPALRRKLAKDYNVDIINEVSGVRSLFKKLWSFDRVKMGFEERVSSNIKSVTLNAKKDRAVITTIAGQEFHFAKEADNVWRTTDFEFLLQQTSLQTIEQNYNILKKLVNEL